jgi:NitT/TauT family transport system substrate-binding protein
MTRTKLIALIGACAAALGIFAAPAALAQGKGETVRFQDYPGLGNMLVRVAIAKGYCERAGIKCELQTIPAAPLGAQAMLANSIQSFMGPAEVMTNAVLKGSKMKMVTGGAVTVVLQLIGGNHIETPNAAKGFPAFMQDFKGKKIGVTARGAATETWTIWMLNKAGIKAEDVTFVAVGGPNTAFGALSSRQVDALMIFEPVGAMCDVLKACKRIWTAATDKEPAEIFAMNGGGVGNVFAQEYIDKNPHVIEAVQKALREADAFINAPANFAEADKISQQFFKLDLPKGAEVMTHSLKLAIDAGAYRVAVNRKALQSGLELLVATKQLDKLLPLNELLHDKLP